MAETKPTPKPAIKRPATRRPNPVEAVCRATPRRKTAQPEMMVKRRPIKSARSPAMMAPKKVPADRMEVMRESLDASRAKPADSASVSGYAKPVC